MRKIGLALCGIMVAGAAWAAGNEVTVSDAWSRATPSANTSAVVYFTVTDKGEGDQLTGATTPIAAKATLHQSTMENGVMHMQAVTAPIDVSEGHPFKATPNGYHLMLTGLTQPLKAGTTFPLSLSFARAGTITVTVPVQAVVPTKKMDGMDMGGMKMDGMDMSH